jgi:hypothetical protein
MSEPFTLKIAAGKVGPEVLAQLTRFAAAANEKNWPALRALVAESPLAVSGLTTDQLSPAIFLPYAEHVRYKTAVAPALCDATQETSPELSLDAAPKLKVTVEGRDHDGDGFCVFFLQWLASVGLVAFEATARSSHGWSAKWSQDAAGLSLVRHKLPRDEEADGAVHAERNAVAEKSTCGFLIKAFKDTLGGDFNRLVRSLLPDSALGLPFSQIIDKLASVRKPKDDTWYSDDRFALRPQTKQLLSAGEVASLHLGRINGFELEEVRKLGPWNFDFAAAVAHVDQAIPGLLYRDVDLNEPATADFHWAAGDISVVLSISEQRLRLHVRRFPDLSAQSPAKVYALYKDGCFPDALHWQQLLALAQAQAELGDPETWCTLGHLHLRGRLGLQRDTARAETCFVEAAERGSGEAAWFLGQSYAHWHHHIQWPKDLHKARRYWQIGADIGHWRCPEGLAWLDSTPAS